VIGYRRSSLRRSSAIAVHRLAPFIGWRRSSAGAVHRFAFIASRSSLRVHRFAFIGCAVYPVE
jgi:hypothetical protein